MGQPTKSSKQYNKQSNHKQFTIKDTIKYRKYYKTFAIGSGAFLIAFIISSMFVPVQNSDAAQLFNVENSRTGYYVNVAGSASIDVSVDATPEGQLVGAVDTITTTTNSPRGYQLYISASPNYLYLNGDSSTAAQGKFSPIGGDLTSATTLGRNTWGFAYDNSAEGVVTNNFAASSYYETENPKYPNTNATYASIPTTTTKIQEINSSNVTTSGTELNVYYGLKASTDLHSGTYSGSITYTAISEGVNTNADTMQDFTTSQCQALPTATKDNYETAKKELIDVRDGKWYTVAKMADGNCWMTDNFNLYDKTIYAGASDFSTGSYTIQPSSNWSGNVYNLAKVHRATNSGYTDQVYYNWTSAVALNDGSTTGQQNRSICPKNWQLPVDDDEETDKSYSKLLGPTYGYGITKGEQLLDPANPAYILGFHDYYGLWNFNGYEEHQGIYGSFLMSTASNYGIHAYFLDYNASSFEYHYGYKAHGRSLRCVAR